MSFQRFLEEHDEDEDCLDLTQYKKQLTEADFINLFYLNETNGRSTNLNSEQKKIHNST